MTTEINDLKVCDNCSLGHTHSIQPTDTLKCAWCGSNFCNSCAETELKQKDSEGELICNECHANAVMEARIESKENKQKETE
jgi:transcription elongation factor Elf1